MNAHRAHVLVTAALLLAIAAVLAAPSASSATARRPVPNAPDQADAMPIACATQASDEGKDGAVPANETPPSRDEPELVPRTPTPAAPFAITDLGTLGGSGSDALAINDRGQVVGISATASGGPLYELGNHGFLWEQSTMTDLTPVDATGCAFASISSEAHDINEAGQVVGWAHAEDGRDQAFLWEHGRLTDLGTLPDFAGSGATAINDKGQVVGWALTADGEAHAVLWEQGRITDLGALPGGTWSVAYAINNRGQVVGTSTTSPGRTLGLHGTHAFLWDNGTMTDLGTLGGSTREAYAINDQGQVVGVSTTGPRQRLGEAGTHAFLWEQGTITDLGGSTR